MGNCFHFNPYNTLSRALMIALFVLTIQWAWGIPANIQHDETALIQIAHPNDQCLKDAQETYDKMAAKAWDRKVGTWADKKEGVEGAAEKIPGCYSYWGGVEGCDEDSQKELEKAAKEWLEDWKKGIKRCTERRGKVIDGACDIEKHLDSEQCKIGE